MIKYQGKKKTGENIYLEHVIFSFITPTPPQIVFSHMIYVDARHWRFNTRNKSKTVAQVTLVFMSCLFMTHMAKVERQEENLNVSAYYSKKS